MEEISSKMGRISNLLPRLPDDLILYKILPRADATSVGRFRCASKDWRYKLSTRAFAKLHLTAGLEHKSEGIIVGVYPSPSSFCVLNLDMDSRHLISKWLKLRAGSQETSICGSVHGLVLAAEFGIVLEDCSLNLFNPVTLETHSLPCIPNTFHYRLGYVGASDDYKIVGISRLSNSGALNISVYSVMERNWRFISKSPYEYYMYEEVCFLNESLHYVACEKNGGYFQIVAFSLEREVFTEVPYPKSLEPFMRNRWGSKPHLTVIQGCLSFVISSRTMHQDNYELWIMRQYNIQDSWRRFKIPIEKDKGIYDYIGVLQDAYLVFRRSDDRLILITLEESFPRALTDCEGEFRVRRFQGKSQFKESIISPSNTYLL